MKKVSPHGFEPTTVTFLPESAPFRSESNARLARMELVLTEQTGRNLASRVRISAASEPIRLLRCATCGRAEPRTATEVERLARSGWPECCGAVMALVNAPPSPAPGRERRDGSRHPARAGVRAEVHRGALGMGPDIGQSLVDLSGDGVRLRLKAPIRPGDETEVTLWPPETGGRIRLRGRAVWCRSAKDWGFLAGVRLRRQLTAEEMTALRRPPATSSTT